MIVHLSPIILHIFKGISDNPDKVHWHRESILDDPNLGMGIKKHYVSFAGTFKKFNRFEFYTQTDQI